MKEKIILGLQILVGLMLVLFGANGFLQFMPMPPPSAQMGAWLGAIAQTGYLFPLIAAIELVAGLAFVFNKFASLMAIILMPVMLNALLAHIFLNDVAGMGGALIVVLGTLLVMFKNRQRYSEIFKA
ncbi:hypothetical protein JHD49_04015 [Sulfurimonas sp. SAG-AH-194-C21]|nr:hypothetical protein [Sulfurimonas sp. SAG-AH-194-C21]MDF1883097.1 hypothetical protein [Sulfurimonas sp. SAG-AH-194-C21]